MRTFIQLLAAATYFSAMVAVVASIIAVLVAWRAYVLTVLWGWFVVPFLGLDGLTMPMALGLSMVATTFVTRGNLKEPEAEIDPALRRIKERDKAKANTIYCLASPAICLVVGWCAKQFM